MAIFGDGNWLSKMNEKWEGANREAGVAVLEHRPPLVSAKPVPKPADVKTAPYYSEYSDLANIVGVAAPDLTIENFKAFLILKDIPVFSLPEVVRYMDAKATKEADKAGWEWRPLRKKDNRDEVRFGKEAIRSWGSSRGEQWVSPASDFYSGPHSYKHRDQLSPSSQPYDKTIPLHALRKVAMIEREFTGDVAFFVCDYAPLPAIQYPDPFLMALVPNVNLARGIGRFVIDFWDEPGFGIEQMIK